MADVEPFPLLPATWTTRTRRCGSPTAPSRARLWARLRSPGTGARRSKAVAPYPHARAPANPLFAAAATVLSAAIRLFPSIKPPNFAPPGALGLYGGARAPLWQALLMTVGAMAVSDVLLQKMFAWPWFNPWVYGCMIGYVLLGRLLLRKSKLAWRIGGVALVATTIFFLVTKFGAFAGGTGKPHPMHPPTPPPPTPPHLLPV